MVSRTHLPNLVFQVARIPPSFCKHKNILEENVNQKIRLIHRLAIWTLVITLLALPLAACGGKPVSSTGGDLKGNITISGAFALYPMMTRWAEEFQKANPGVQFDLSAGGAGKGMADALSGAVDIGMVSRDITSDEEGKGAYWVGVTKDAVFPSINAQNPVLQDLLSKGLTQETLIDIFVTGKITTWGQAVGRPEIADQIHVFTRSDACGASEVWAKYLGNKKQEDLLGVGVYGDPGLLDAVVKDPLGIGYNNLNYAFDMASGKPVQGSVVLPIDRNGDGKADTDELLETKAEASEMVANGKYPSPPARVLNLVTKGKPTGVVQAFIAWILTDGQKYVGEVGYIQLTQEQIDASLAKIK
jgi:phosphate transport system substrate-binding protein